jgi:RNA polymerase sigma-70 factor (ECF subfamily)
MKHFADETVLMKHLVSGDHGAYCYLYSRNRSWMFAKVNSIVKNSTEAEEVVQDVFIQIFKSIAQFNGACSIKSWIYRIAVNKAINRLRSMKSKKHSLFVLFGDTPPDHMIPHGFHEHDGAEAQAGLCYEEITWLMNRLPGRQREAFLLCKLQGKSYEEAAGIMQCTVESIRGLMQRARKELKHEVSQLIMNRQQIPMQQVA